jgi:hypothetical protein
MRFLLPVLLSCLGIFSGCGGTKVEPPQRRSWTFPADGVSKVKLHASRAANAVIRTAPKATTITVSGRPTLAANSYHAPDPADQKTPAHEWPFEMTASRSGRTLTLTAKGETTFRQHRYFLNALEIETPPGVEVVREPQAPAKAAP